MLRQIKYFQAVVQHHSFSEAARMLVISGKGFLPSEGTPIEGSLGTNLVRIPLYRGTEPIRRNYCAFWKKERAKKTSEEFAEILRRKFES